MAEGYWKGGGGGRVEGLIGKEDGKLISVLPFIRHLAVWRMMEVSLTYYIFLELCGKVYT